MSWIALAFGAAFSWGLYGASLHKGQMDLGNPLRALLCVGAAYFLIGVIVPVLALSSQVLGWLLISASLPRLPAAHTSLLLTIQPVGSVVLGALLFAEAPSGLQLVGVAAILAGLVMVARVRPPPMEGI